MTAITYWLIRYVPDVARGEFQNIGIICGSDDGDWVVGLDWGYLERRSIPRDVREWAHWLAREVNSHDRLATDHEFTRAWVEGIRQRQANAIQLSAPQPTAAVNARAAAEILYPLLVHHDRPARRHRMTRRSVRTAIRGVYQTSDLREGLDFFASPSIRLGHMSGEFDFIQTNEATPILRSAWAFDMVGIESLQRDINAWNYGITRLRDDGATFVHGGMSTPVPTDAVVTAVVDAPADSHGEGRDLYEAVLEAWEREQVEVLTLEQLDERLNPWVHRF